LLMLHSIVDYPLRTSTMLAYFAACCGLMACGRADTSRDGTRHDVEPVQFPMTPQLERGSQ
jgi:hypothetical protein